MIRFFRRALSSWIVLGLFALIMIAFIVTGVGTPSSLGNLAGASNEMVAKVGGEKIGIGEVNQRAQLTVENARQRQPELNMATFVKQGGIDEVVNQLVSAKAMEIWARAHGIGASKRLIDGEIASISAFQGPTGQFDEQVYRSMLSQRRITEAQLRNDIHGDLIRNQVLIPVSGSIRAPTSLVSPYAALMLERREGFIGAVPIEAMLPQAKPTDAQLNGWYGRNLALYTQPERRIIRYALISKEQIKTLPTPTEAEIKAFYDANAASYGGIETRSFSQVILPDQKSADAFVAQMKAGASFADAARKAGFAPTDTAIGAQTQAQLEALATAEVARAAYATPQGGTTAPLKSALGWHILHVDSVKKASGKSLEAAHAEIAASLGKQKIDEAIADLIAQMEDEVADGANFDEVVRKHGLTVKTSPPVNKNGQIDGKPSMPFGDPYLQVLLKTAFEASPDDDPTVETIGNGQYHALLKVGQVLPAAPIPFANVRDRVALDFMRDRAFATARDVASKIAARAATGVPLARAIAEAGMPLPPPQPAGARQIDIAQSGRPAPPPLAMMFAMKPGTARILEIPDKRGWFVVQLAKVEKGDIAKAPGLVDATRGEFNNMISQELIEQFSRAVQGEVGTTRNEQAISALKSQLRGTGGQ